MKWFVHFTKGTNNQTEDIGGRKLPGRPGIWWECSIKEFMEVMGLEEGGLENQDVWRQKIFEGQQSEMSFQ